MLYDGSCMLCVRCAEWIAGKPAALRLELIPAGSSEARTRYPAFGLGEELVVVSDDGQVWLGPSAFVMCLWALRDTRDLSELLAEPPMSFLARRFFNAFSSSRGVISGFIEPGRCGEQGCTLPTPRAPYR